MPLICLLIFVFSTHPSFADTIIMKNGSTLEGDIVERTEEYLKLDVGEGVVLTYFFDDIEYVEDVSIEGKDDLAEIKDNSKETEANYQEGIDFFVNSVGESVREEINAMNQAIEGVAGSSYLPVNILSKKIQNQEAVMMLQQIFMLQGSYADTHEGVFAGNLDDLGMGKTPLSQFKELDIYLDKFVSCNDGPSRQSLGYAVSMDSSYELHILEDGQIACLPCGSSVCQQMGY